MFDPSNLSKDKKTTRQYLHSAIYPFFDGISAISPSLGGWDRKKKLNLGLKLRGVEKNPEEKFFQDYF